MVVVFNAQVDVDMLGNEQKARCVEEGIGSVLLISPSFYLPKVRCNE